MNHFFQRFLSTFESNVGYLDEVFDMLASMYPKAAHRFAAERSDLQSYVTRANSLFQNPFLLPFHMISLYFLLRSFAKRTEKCLHEIVRITEEEEFKPFENDLLDDDFLKYFKIPAPPPDLDATLLFTGQRLSESSSFSSQAALDTQLGLGNENNSSSSLVTWCLSGENIFPSSFASSRLCGSNYSPSLVPSRLGGSNSSSFSALSASSPYLCVKTLSSSFPPDSRLQTPDFFHSAFIIHNLSFSSHSAFIRPPP